MTDRDSDEALILCEGAEGFGVLYCRYARAVYAYLYARLRNVQEADDTTSAVFFRAWEKRQTFRAEAPFKTWLFTIAHNVLVDHHRKQRQSVRFSDDGAEALDETWQPEDIVKRSEQCELVRAMLRSLSPEQQEIIGLRFWAGLAYTEIAQVVGKREAAVKMTAYRAIEELRRRFPNVR